jgi:phage shock protein A
LCRYAEVQRLEREKEMQAEQLRMMEERMIDQELTEEELDVMQDELERAREEAAALSASKESLEQELGWQLAQKEEWSQRLRVAEEGERELTVGACTS